MGDGRGADGGSSFPQVKGKYLSKHVGTEGVDSNGEGGESEGTVMKESVSSRASCESEHKRKIPVPQRKAGFLSPAYEQSRELFS